MTLLMRDQENFDRGKVKGEEIGIIKGQNMMLELIQKLVADGRLEEIAKIKSNESYCQKLFEEYNI